MFDLRLPYVQGVQKAGHETGVLKIASEEEDQLRSASVAQAMEDQDMPVPGDHDLDGAAEVINALKAIEEGGSPAEAASAEDAEAAVAKVKELIAADLTGAKQPAQAQVPHADSNLQSVNEDADAKPQNSAVNSEISGGEVGTESPKKPDAQPKVPAADSNLQSVNEDADAKPQNSAVNSEISGGEIGKDKSEKSASLGLFGTIETKDILNRIRTL